MSKSHGSGGKKQEAVQPLPALTNKENRLQFINDLMIKFIARVQDVREAREEAGQTLVEYGLILALISIVAIAALTTIGTNVKSVFTSVGGSLTSP